MSGVGFIAVGDGVAPAKVCQALVATSKSPPTEIPEIGMVLLDPRQESQQY